jgi:restriction system protein
MLREILSNCCRICYNGKYMNIPDYQAIMLPLLKFANDKNEHSIREAIEYISNYFHLSEEERNTKLPSGQQTVVENRTGWARTYMKKALLVESKKRGYFNITDRGLEVLNKNPSEINQKYLEQFPEFVEFKSVHKEENNIEIDHSDNQTPQESLEYGYQKIRKDLAQELLADVKNCSPSFFEKLVVELLLRMGYGGTLKDAGKAIGQSGDGGIDGIIKEDKLGLDVIYIQAKRWDGVVGRPEIMKFVGALHGQKAKKGVFITTSSFTKDAIEYAPGIDPKIVLLDGEALTQLMIDNNIGVTTISTYEIKKIDSDYFIEE